MASRRVLCDSVDLLIQSRFFKGDSVGASSGMSYRYKGKHWPFSILSRQGNKLDTSDEKLLAPTPETQITIFFADASGKILGME